MILNIFTVFDSKAEAYLPPFYMSSIGQAQRAFTDSVSNPEHQFGKHPEDYTLFLIGNFDDSSCAIDMHTTPVSLGTGIELSSVSQVPKVPDGSAANAA
jgi:hypothetical protein